MEGERAHDQSHESSQFQASGLYRRYGETMVIPWNEWVACFKGMGEKGESLALKYWNESHGEFRLSGAPHRTDLDKNWWDLLRATKLKVLGLMNPGTPDAAVSTAVLRDQEPTVAITPADRAAARAALKKLEMERLSPDQQKLVDAINEAFTINDLLEAVKNALGSNIENYPLGSGQRLSVIRNILLELQAAERGDFAAAQELWSKVSPQLPAGIRNNFVFGQSPPDPRPVLVRRDRAN